ETPEYRFADDAGNISDSSKATLTLDGEFSRTPGSPLDINFKEDTNKDGKISNKENQDGDKEVGKTTAEISIPKDGSVKPGDKLIVKDNSDKPKEHVITEKDIENGKIEVTVDIKTGDKTTITAEIVNPSNPSKPSEEISKDITEASSTVQVTIDEIYDDVAGGVVNGDVKNGLTNDNLPTFKGSAAPGATVEIYESFLTTTEKTLVGKTVADANGKWSFTPTEAMGDGLHYFEALATDSAGNKSITPKVELDVDATAPSVENLKVSPLDISNPADNTPEKGRVEGSSDTQDAKVIVKDEAGNVIGEGKVRGDGKFVIDTTKPLNPGDKVKVEITDEAGNTGKGSAVTGKDIIHTHATTQVTIDEIYDDVAGGVVNGDVKNGLTNDNLPTFKGSAAPGATVEIYESFLTTTEKTLVGKTVADANGKWSFTPTEAMGDGEHYFEAVATDKVGNKSTSDRVSLDVDTFADAPVIDTVNDNVDSQTGNVLDVKTKVALTNDSTPTLEGYAEPDSVITIYEISELNGDKTAIGTVTADNHGGWKFELPELGDGEYKYTTRAQDKAGNISGFSETVIVNVDLVAPSEPTITFVEDINKKDGMLNKAENGKDGDSTSTKAQISVPGDAEENDVIHYTVNGEEKTHTITYNDRVAGYIEVKVPVVDGKTSTITAKIVDQAGNSSEMVKESISSDFTAPNVQIIGIIDNVPGGTYKDNVAGTSTNDNKPTIKGKADANKEVVIYDTDKEIGRTTADKNGNWEFKPSDYKEPLADLVGRVHIIKAVVTDAAGNSSEATSALEVDTTVDTPKVKFKEDLNNNEVLSVEEAKALTDGKLHWIVEIPTDGVSVKAGDILQVYGQDGKWKNATFITKEDIAKGSVERDGFVMDLPKGNGAQSPAYRIVDIVGNESEGNFANLVYDKELTRQPSNPTIKFPEDTNEDGKISDKENKEGDKDAGKTTAEISIPKDGSVKPGDKLIVTDNNGKETVRPIEQSDIDKGSIDVPVDLNPGKDNTIIAEIVNPNNPDNPGKGKGVIGENSEATKVPEAPVITDVIDDVEGGKFNQSVKGGLTNDNTPTIKGTAKAGSTVVIYDNGVEIGRIEKADANWEFTTPVLTKQGEHKFTAIAKNEFGESGSSNEVSIELDTIAPSVENVKVTPIDMSDPADSTSEKGRVEGRSDTPGAIVVIKDQAGNEIGRDNVKADKSFTIETTKPINKGDKVTVEITDEAGNTGKGEAEAGSIKHEGDNAAPCDPTITFVEDTAPKDGKLNKAENGSDSDNANTKARISFLPDVVEGDVIRYTINNGKEESHTVTADDVKAGYIEFQVPVVDGKTSTVTAKIVDQAGNASEMVKESISSDFTAPNTPVITAVIDEWYGGVEFDNVLGKDKGLTNDNTPKFKGTAEAGSTIVLKNGNEIIGEDIEVKANGTWEFTPKTPLADGEYNVTATATDKAGNVSNPSNVATINVDTNCAKPVITEIIDDVAGGAVNGDVKFGLTNDNLPTLKGTAEAFAEVKFMIDGRPVFKDGKQVSVTADENGKWEYTLEVNSNWGGKVHAALEDGRHTFEAQATDKAGNNSKPSDVVSVDVDTTARAPKVMITADADDNNILTATEASALTDGKLKWVIKLPEDAKEGDRIEVSNSHREWVTVLTLSAANVAKGEVVRDDFSADFVKGRPGFQTPSYRIVDQAGNISAEGTDSVRFDKTASRAPVIKEVIDDHKGYDDDTRVGDVLKVEGGLTNDNTPTIKGTAEAGIKVDIYDNGKFIGTTKADTNGNWDFTPSTSAVLPDGKHSITAVAENALGVKSASSNAANIDVDTVTPKPTIDSITDNVEGGVYKGDVKGGLTNDNRPVFEGKAEKGAFIELFDNDKVIGTTKAGEDGKWTIQPKEPMADGKHNMVVQATDLAGNRSRSDQTSSDVDTTSPGVVKITAVCDDVAGYNGKVGNILGVNNGLTDDSTPTIKGTAKPGVTITIKDGDKVVDGDIKYNGDGSWEFTPKTPLAEGKHELTAIATSKTGVVSNPSNVAAIDVDTKIADAKVEFIEDTNNDGKFSWKENIENTHTGRLSWKALIPDDGSIKAGDIFHYKWDETGWHERAISQAEIDRGYIGEMKNNQIDKDQPDAGKPIPYGKNANGSVYVAEAFFSDAAGNKGAKGSDKIVFDFSDSESGAKTVNVKITSIDDNVPGWNGKTGNIITNEAAHIAGLTNDNTPTISGTTEAGAIVKVSIVNGKTHKVWESDVKANENGEWSITTGNIADGKYSVVAVATDKSGVASSPYTVSGLEIDTTVAKPNIWVAEDRNHDGFYDNAEYYNPANGKGDITFVVEVPKDGSVKVGDTFHYTLNTDYKGWSSINGYGENITISQADIDNGSFSRVVTLCKDNQHFDLRHDGATVSMKGQFKDLAGNALADETSVKFDLNKVHSGKVRSTRSLPDDILDNDSVDLSNAARINEPKAELNVLNNNKIGVSANDLLETPKDHIMSEGKSEAKPSYATASSHAGEENIATTHPIQIEEKVESHF
ncbi:Ig-like domain-containing protein, partial [Campylobacter concisus]